MLSDDELRELWTALECVANEGEEETSGDCRPGPSGPGGVDRRAGPFERGAVDDARDLRAKPRLTPATAQAFQVQLPTAQRPGEVRSMRWADVDLDNGWWSMPASVAKNARPHRVPLTDPVLEILEHLRELAGEGAIFVFENRGGAGSIAHRGRKAASMLCRGLSFEFRAHDLRRTTATRMAEAGVPRDHIAKVLNHVEGGPAATRVYDRYAYDAEKREALERRGRRRQAILEGRTKKVVPVRA